MDEPVKEKVWRWDRMPCSSGMIFIYNNGEKVVGWIRTKNASMWEACFAPKGGGTVRPAHDGEFLGVYPSHREAAKTVETAWRFRDLSRLK